MIKTGSITKNKSPKTDKNRNIYPSKSYIFILGKEFLIVNYKSMSSPNATTLLFVKVVKTEKNHEEKIPNQDDQMDV